MNMFNINTKKIINAGLSQTTFCGSSMGSKPVLGREGSWLCVYYYDGNSRRLNRKWFLWRSRESKPNKSTDFSGCEFNVFGLGNINTENKQY